MTIEVTLGLSAEQARRFEAAADLSGTSVERFVTEAAERAAALILWPGPPPLEDLDEDDDDEVLPWLQEAAKTPPFDRR